MILADVNVLIYALREDSAKHSQVKDWLSKALAGPENFGYSEFVMSSVVRITTHPRIFKSPSSLEEVFEFTDALRAAPASVRVSPGPMHWAVFQKLCREVEARGNLVPDAYLAAMAQNKPSNSMTADS